MHNTAWLCHCLGDGLSASAEGEPGARKRFSATDGPKSGKPLSPSHRLSPAALHDRVAWISIYNFPIE